MPAAAFARALAPLSLAICLGQVGPKLPVPDTQSQKKNEKSIRDLLKEAYQKRDQNSRRQLARNLIEAGDKEVKDWDMVYSLYKEASDLAADAADFETAMAAIEQLEKVFKIEPESPLTGATFSPRHELRKAIFKRTQKSVQGIEDATAYVKAGLKLAELYYSEDWFDDGLAVSQMAEAVAAASGDKGLQMLVQGHVRKYMMLKREHDKVAKAHLKILADPTDADAALSWGLFLAFVKEDWDRAVEWIGKSKEGALKDICKKESERAAPEVLATGWLALTEKAKEPEKLRFRKRAHYWLEKALPAATGVEKLKLEKKLEDLNKALGIADLVKLVDPMRDFSSKGQGKGGSAKIAGTKLILEGADFQTGFLEFPYSPPQEYTLTITARHAGGSFVPFHVGLSDGTRQWVISVGLNNPTLGATPGLSNVDGKPLPLDDAAKSAASVPLGSLGAYIFTVRSTGFSVSVNGKDAIDWTGDMKRLSVPDSMGVSRKNTLFIAAQCRYEIECVVVVPLSGQGQKLR